MKEQTLSRNKKIPVKILNIKDDKLKIKLPFLDIPITMNDDFFKRRVANGYFQINENKIKQRFNIESLN
ncbi:MAG: hypothetical protein AB8G86_21355 [Saprospiraceae bacterium]